MTLGAVSYIEKAIMVPEYSQIFGAWRIAAGCKVSESLTHSFGKFRALQIGIRRLSLLQPSLQ